MKKIFFLLLLCLAAGSESKAGGEQEKNSTHQALMASIGGVVDFNSRVGKEQKVAMKMAVEDYCGGSAAGCSKRLLLRIKDSAGGDTAAAASTTIELIENKKVQAIIGNMAAQEAVLFSGVDRNIKAIPIISLASPVITQLIIAHTQLMPNFFQMSNPITSQMECIADLVGHFRWRKVTAIYEQTNAFPPDFGLVTLLSDALKVVNSEVEHHTAVPSFQYLPNPGSKIEQELNTLRNRSNRVFVLVKSSIEFATLLFQKAKQMRMMEKGYVWIVTDEVASLLDSVDSSLLNDMEGVIGFKTNFNDTTKSFKQFKHIFRRIYGLKYPEEEEHSNPSIFALRAYDAATTIAQAIEKLKGTQSTIRLSRSISSSNFEGLTGKIAFKNNTLWQQPSFQIINVVGNSYREMAVWSPEGGFLEKNTSNSIVEFGSIYWPGGEQTVPRGFATVNSDKPLRIAVPASGAFHQFVTVIPKEGENATHVTGFSIQVFEAAVQQLPYHLDYKLVPFYGTYDEMVQQVKLQVFDAAVGDTEIMSDRFQYAQFSQPYVNAGLVMVVTQEPEKSKATLILKTFTARMWVLMATMHISIGFIVWLIERNHNDEFKGVGVMLWFSVTVIFYAHQHVKSTLARIVLAPWLFVILIVTASFTASLTSMITVSQLQPSILNLETLKSLNAGVGCDGNSFIMQYLINVLKIEPENIKNFYSFDDYPEAFRAGHIKAAFFTEPHAKVFLGKYCNAYARAGPTFQLGGLGFVFQRGSPLAYDMSEAILKVIETGEIGKLEEDMLLPFNCTSSNGSTTDDSNLDMAPFSGMFIVAGGIAFLVLFVNTVSRQRRNLQVMLIRIKNATIKYENWRWPRIQVYKGTSHTTPTTTDRVVDQTYRVKDVELIDC